MANISGFDESMMDYFNTLPKYIQENILQSNNKISNYTELVNCSENMMKKA